MLFAIRGMKPHKKWRINPDLRRLASHLHKYEDSALTEWVGDSLQESVVWNETIVVAKGSAVIKAARSLAVMAVLVIALAVTVNVIPS